MLNAKFTCLNITLFYSKRIIFNERIDEKATI